LGGLSGVLVAADYDSAKIAFGEVFDTATDGRSCASVYFNAEDGELSLIA
jgi:hypothetical protein